MKTILAITVFLLSACGNSAPAASAGPAAPDSGPAADAAPPAADAGALKPDKK